MPVTINVNGLSLVHKGSDGISTATVPNVCKTPTPGGPAPVPYPNIARSADLVKGTRTVRADGGNMIAIEGSEFSKSVGDEPGSLGGVKSGTTSKEATWLSYSFDVQFEGKGACRLTDKMLHNHDNTVDLAGILQAAIMIAHPGVIPELAVLCDMMCDIKNEAGPKQKLVERELKKRDLAMGGRSTMKAEVPYDPKATPPSPYMSKNDPSRATSNWYIPGHRRPDVVITDGGPPVMGNIRAVVEMKFKDGGTPFSRSQADAYRKMFKRKFVTMQEGVDCECPDKKPPVPPVPVRKRAFDLDANWWKQHVKQVALAGAVAVLAVATVAACINPLNGGPVGGMAVASLTATTYAAAFAH